mgnify:CR=1 FL=1
MHKWGVLANGVYRSALPTQRLPNAPPMVGRTLVRDEAVPSHRIKELVSYERKPLAYFGTPRVAQQGACMALSVRGQHDYATQLRYLDDYVTKYPKPSARGNTPHPNHSEWLNGLPRNWTSLDEPVPAPVQRPAGRRLRTLDLFSGCGGLTLGLHPWMETVAYCEVEPRYRALLAARIQSGHLDPAPILEDVTRLTKATLFAALGTPVEADAVECIVGGFPCQDVSTGGKRKGFDGNKTVLFKEVERLVVEIRPKYVLLENVRPLTSMPAVWQYVLLALHRAGYDARWCSLTAKNVGSPQSRPRWLLWGVRRDVAAEHGMGLPTVAPITRADLEAVVAQPWNGQEPDVDHRMLSGSCAGTKTRLNMLGNMVVPQCAALALGLMAANGTEWFGPQTAPTRDDAVDVNRSK